MVSRLPNYGKYGFGQKGGGGPPTFPSGRNPAIGGGGGYINRRTGQGYVGPGTNPNFPATPEQQGLSISQAPGAWNAVFQSLEQGQGPGQGLIPEIMRRFPGGQGRHMQKWFSEAAPMLAMTLFGSPSYKYMQDPTNWDDSMGAYGAGAGIMGQQAGRGLQQGQNQLARMGLGRSGAQAALANQTTQALGAQQGNLFANLHQQSIQNRLAGAQGAFDLDRAIMQMAMGSTQMPPARQRSAGLGGPIASALGSAVGMGLGGLASGAFGGGGGGRSISPQVGPSGPGSNWA